MSAWSEANQALRYRKDPKYRREQSARASAWQKANRARCNANKKAWRERCAAEGHPEVRK